MHEFSVINDDSSKTNAYKIILGRAGAEINQPVGDQIHTVINSIMAAAPRGQNQARWHPYRQ